MAEAGRKSCGAAGGEGGTGWFVETLWSPRKHSAWCSLRLSQQDYVRQGIKACIPLGQM